MREKIFLITFFLLFCFKNTLAQSCGGPLIVGCTATTVMTKIGDQATTVEIKICGFEALIQTFLNLAQFFLNCLLFWGATAGVVFGGLTILLARGSSESINKGRRIIIYALEGIIVGFLAGPVIKLIKTIFVKSEIWKTWPP